MINNLSYLKHESFANILNNIHAQMQIKINAIQEQKDAQQIESLLRQVKKAVIALRNPSDNSAILKRMQPQLAELIQNVYQQQKFYHSKNLKATTLLQRKHSSTTSISGTDDIFEEELGYIIQQAARMKGNEDFNVNSVLTGQRFSSINNITQSISDKVLDIINRALENQAKKLNYSKDKKYSKIEARAGKIDINTVGLNIKMDGDDIIAKLLRALSGKTFSLKNYTSSYWKDGQNILKDDLRIYLGSTNPYKAITTVLSDFYSDPRAQRSIFYRGMNILAGNGSSATDDQVNQHFGHMRFIYELQGTGILSQSNQRVQYIIWNDPSSENIVVRSTGMLIKQHWEQYSGVFNRIAISGFKI